VGPAGRAREFDLDRADLLLGQPGERRPSVALVLGKTGVQEFDQIRNVCVSAWDPLCYRSAL
jgi:hypothetical protein